MDNKAFSTVVGGVASDREDRAAAGRLDAAGVLLDRREALARELPGGRTA